MVLIMLVSNTCVCPKDLISANNAAITRLPKLYDDMFYYNAVRCCQTAWRS